MRPRFSDEEILFVLQLLRETEQTIKHQIKSLTEEALQAKGQIVSLRETLMYDSRVAPSLGVAKDHLRVIEAQLPRYDQENIILEGMVTRFERILAHRRGRLPYKTIWMNMYLGQLYQKTAVNTVTHV